MIAVATNGRFGVCVQWQIEVFVWGVSDLAVLCGKPLPSPLLAAL